METTEHLIKRLRYWAFDTFNRAECEDLLEAAERLEELQGLEVDFAERMEKLQRLEVDFHESLRLATEANKDLQARIVQLELELGGEEE